MGPPRGAAPRASMGRPRARQRRANGTVRRRAPARRAEAARSRAPPPSGASQQYTPHRAVVEALPGEVTACLHRRRVAQTRAATLLGPSVCLGVRGPAARLWRMARRRLARRSQHSAARRRRSRVASRATARACWQPAADPVAPAGHEWSREEATGALQRRRRRPSWETPQLKEKRPPGRLYSPEYSRIRKCARPSIFSKIFENWRTAQPVRG